MKWLKLIIFACCFFGFNACLPAKKDEHSAIVNLRLLLDSAKMDMLPAERRINILQRADSIASRLNNDSQKNYIVLKLSQLYMAAGNTALAEEYLSKCVAISRALDDSMSLAVCYANLALLSSEAIMPDTAINYFEAAKGIFRTKDSLKYAECLVNEGIMYKNHGLFTKAYAVTLQATEILQTHQRENELASAYSNLGNILKDMNAFPAAKKYHQQALAIYVLRDDSAGIAASYNNLGNVLKSEGKYTAALSAYFKSAGIKQRWKQEKSLGITFNNIATVYLELKDYESARQYLQQTLMVRKAIGDTEGIIVTSLRLSKLFNETGASSKALETLSQVVSFAQQHRLTKHLVEAAQLLSSIYFQRKNYEQSAFWARKTIALKDSLYGSQIQQAIFDMEMKYQTKQRERELEHAHAMYQIQSYQIRDQRLIIFLMSTVILLCLVLILLLYRITKFRKKAKERVELLMKELNHRVKNNLQVISGLFTLQIASTTNADAKQALLAALKRVESINVIHRLLQQSEYSGHISMQPFLLSLIENTESIMEGKSANYQLDTEIDDVNMNINEAVSVGLIINELVTNIYKYGKNGETPILIKLAFVLLSGKGFELIIEDNCSPWNIEDAKVKSTGSGLLLVEILVEQLRGKWQTYSNENGTVHLINFKN